MQYLRSALNQLAYQCSRLIPRSKGSWVFIGWHIGSDMEILADNTKYLFLHISQHHKDIRAVWLAKDRKLAALLCSRGYRSYYQYSPQGIWAALRAGTTVIDAFFQPENFRWSGGTRLVQLLHGRGMKKKGYNVPPPRAHDDIFCPSPFIEGLLAPVFIQDAHIYHTGYARNDVLFRSIAGSDISVDERLRQKLEAARASGKRCILYAPTFRRGEKVFGLASKFDLEKIDTRLAPMNAHLSISLHPKYRDQAREGEYANISFVEDSDIYPLLSSFDLFISDYSSLIYDYLLLDRPIVFFPYDLEEYSAGEGLAFPYETYTPGPKAYDADTLLELVDKTLEHEEYAAERKRVRETYFVHADGNSCERITAQLLQ
ncbi:MAG TPA: CDP-glycerol glycerophosphotransferase family protein [Candidatus Paceibacterota bacterium]|jgi:CDP-glycerol glycerophosphotransferase (TagB/SpsB family)|nr:CDP-glycerol glycerophosphotransferase family protein [Candidatus Paceibacterota bacterium]